MLFHNKYFSLALGIKEPWYIKSLDMVPSINNPEILEMRVEVDFIEGIKFSYNGSKELHPVHDTRERSWRHLSFFQYRCYIQARVHRILLSDGKIKTVDVPWGHDISGFTLMA